MLSHVLRAAVALALLSGAARADSVADFYRGKTVQFLVGYGPGGGYDVYARLIARFLGRYLPGTPNVVVVNMPGAGSLRAANYLYANAPRDGTVVGSFARDMVLMQVLGGNANVQFDARKFTWLGSGSSTADDAYMLFVRNDAPTRTIADARTDGTPIVVAGTAEGASGSDVAVLLRDVLHLNLKLINGYPDSGAIFLAVDRHEVDGRFGGLSAVRSSRPQWLAPGGAMRVLLQFGRTTRHPAFADVPTARELAGDDRARALIQLAEAPYQLARPVAAPPDIPADRARALQKAFMDLQTDGEYRQEAERLGIDVSPVDGKAAMALVEQLASAPADIRLELRRLQAAGP